MTRAEPLTPIALALRNLRHLYEQMLTPGAIVNQASAARGLLGPAIETVERLDAELATLRDALTLAAAELQAARDERDEARRAFDLGRRPPNVAPLIAHMNEIGGEE